MEYLIRIKTCTTENIQDLIDLSTKSYLENYTYLWSDDGLNYIENNFNFDKLSREMSDPNAAFFLISERDKPIGFMKVNIVSPTDIYSTGSVLELERIYLLGEASGKGYGKAAIGFVKEFATKNQKKAILLKAMESSPSVNFYKKQGFKIVGECILNYPYIKSEFQNMFIMHCELE